MRNASTFARGGAELNASKARETASDESLMRLIAAGDRAAMGALFCRHNARVFRFITRVLGDAIIAEDIVSDVFIEVWRQAANFQGRSQVSTWMLSIARFKALSARRRCQAVELDEATAASIADQADTPEELVLRSDRGAQLRACLKLLSPEHREIVDLVYYLDRTIEEIAEIIDVPKNTVKTRMFYARKRLAQFLASNQKLERVLAEAGV
jgi:RNA polymerase sigma-70 factor (ECF subfamily)